METLKTMNETQLCDNRGSQGKNKNKNKNENGKLKVRAKSEMKLDNSKMKVENLKLKSQPVGIMVKWKSAKLIEDKTMTKVTQKCTETETVALLPAF